MLFFEKWMTILKRSGININYEAIVLPETKIYQCKLSANWGCFNYELSRQATFETHLCVKDSLMGDLLKYVSISLPYTE